MLPHQNCQLDSPKRRDKSDAAATDRYSATLRQRLASFDSVEREAGKSQNRLKRAFLSALIGVAFTSIMLLVIAFPWMYPKDLEGLEIFLGVSVVLSVYFVFSFYLLEWVESRMGYYWFWRTSSVLLCLAIAGGLLYVMFSTAGFWLPHFR